jgi:hypothetical protein
MKSNVIKRPEFVIVIVIVFVIVIPSLKSIIYNVTLKEFMRD